MKNLKTDGIYPEYRYFEDFVVGERFRYGAWEMREEDMLAYARMYDPEPFHTDPDAAKTLGWAGLVASGPQLVGIFRRLSKDAFPNSETVISPGWDSVRWFRPVHPGDVLTCLSEILECRPLSSRPGEGLMKFHTDMMRGGEEKVSSVVANWFVRRRPD